jgi:hypothetical protein
MSGHNVGRKRRNVHVARVGYGISGHRQRSARNIQGKKKLKKILYIKKNKKKFFDVLDLPKKNKKLRILRIAFFDLIFSNEKRIMRKIIKNSAY